MLIMNFQVQLGAIKAVLSVRKHLTLPEGRFGPTKCNNIGTFQQIVGPKRPSGTCCANCFLTDRTALGAIKVLDKDRALKYVKQSAADR